MGTCPTCGQHTGDLPPQPRAAARVPRPVAEWDRPHARASQAAVDRGLAAMRAALEASHGPRPGRPARSGAATAVEQRARALAFIARRAPDVLKAATAAGREAPPPSGDRRAR